MVYPRLLHSECYEWWWVGLWVTLPTLRCPTFFTVLWEVPLLPVLFSRDTDVISDTLNLFAQLVSFNTLFTPFCHLSKSYLYHLLQNVWPWPRSEVITSFSGFPHTSYSDSLIFTFVISPAFALSDIEHVVYGRHWDFSLSLYCLLRWP